jgi:competence protein ComEC
MAHFLAISGLHVGILWGVLSGLLAMAMRPDLAAISGAGLTWAYVIIIGAPASAIRAAILLTGWAAARARGRPARGGDLLGLAAIALLLPAPLLIAEQGFQLSFAGFAGLGAGGAAAAGARDYLRRRAPRWGRSGVGRTLFRRASLAFSALACGSGAFLATAPISAAHFQQVAPSALVSHFVGAPLTALAVPALGLTLALPDPVAAIAGHSATSILRWMVAASLPLSEIPGGSLEVGSPTGMAWTAYGLLAWGLWRFVRSGSLLRVVLPWTFASALLLAAPWIRALALDGTAVLCSIDVGQGDAAALRTPRGHWMVIDAGPRTGRWDAGRQAVVPLVRKLGADRIELFVLSHPDMDHLGGFDSILDALPVRRLLDSGDALPSKGYASLLDRAIEEGVQWLDARQGDRLTLDGVSLTVLGPLRSSAPRSGGSRSNATSLTIRVRVHDFVYLNTGDATADQERALLAAWPPDSLRTDILKVGHHGSRTSTDRAWLDATRPRLALISAGRGNVYGHPHPTVVQRLRDASIPRVWRTDREGTLCVEIDRGGRWRIRGESDWLEPAATARVLTSGKGVE